MAGTISWVIICLFLYKVLTLKPQTFYLWKERCAQIQLKFLENFNEFYIIYTYTPYGSIWL